MIATITHLLPSTESSPHEQDKRVKPNKPLFFIPCIVTYVFFFKALSHILVYIPAGRVTPAVSVGLGDGSASTDSTSACSDTKPRRQGPANQNTAQLYL